ncbi:hypothetical protein PoB_000337900 [Plakobranchus ocellatus]|uniref:Uncharacterized protein n=1 Tax=Plakobranchus ocellatus TaxID=259542 RepID=A0AAV3Y1Q1_9GAST|nr:hypothetical protein PoB_000337900 [Plakobranchus ocellatus]
MSRDDPEVVQNEKRKDCFSDPPMNNCWGCSSTDKNGPLISDRQTQTLKLSVVGQRIKENQENQNSVENDFSQAKSFDGKLLNAVTQFTTCTMNDPTPASVISLTDSESSSLLSSQVSNSKEFEFHTTYCDVKHDQQLLPDIHDPANTSPSGPKMLQTKPETAKKIRHNSNSVGLPASFERYRQGNTSCRVLKPDSSNLQNPELRSSHRFGHVLAWNKTSSGKSGLQVGLLE